MLIRKIISSLYGDYDMDEDALVPTTADNSELAHEVRAELQSLARGARETIGKKWSPHTHRAYAGAWSRFVEWTSARGLSSLPADPAILILYLEHLVQEGRAKTTIRTAASAVSAAHKAAGFSGGNPSAHEDVKDFLRGVEREAPPQRQAAAMLPDVISAIRATARTPRRGRGGRMENSGTAEARARVDVALALTLRDGGLRVSEAAALTWKDVERWADGSGRLTIRQSKSNRTGEPETVAITPACLQALDAIRMGRAEDRDRVFRLTPRQMTNRIKAACRAAGLEGDVFSGHSGRVGLARMMSGAGAPTETTMRQGRWKSAEMVRRYTRAETAGAALRWMDGGTETGL